LASTGYFLGLKPLAVVGLDGRFLGLIHIFGLGRRYLGLKPLAVLGLDLICKQD
jgi:hypothetical protein